LITPLKDLAGRIKEHWPEIHYYYLTCCQLFSGPAQGSGRPAGTAEKPATAPSGFPWESAHLRAVVLCGHGRLGRRTILPRGKITQAGIPHDRTKTSRKKKSRGRQLMYKRLFFARPAPKESQRTRKLKKRQEHTVPSSSSLGGWGGSRPNPPYQTPGRKNGAAAVVVV